MKPRIKLLALLLSAVMLLGCIVPAFAAGDGLIDVPITQLDLRTEAGAKPAPYKADELVHAIVLLEGQCAAEAGDAGSVKAATQTARLTRQHNTLKTALRRVDSCRVIFEYTTLLNGMALEIPYGQLDRVRAMDGVKAVYIANKYTLPQLPQADASPTAGDTALQSSSTGKGMVVAVIDSGLRTSHEAFQDYGMTADVLTPDSLARTETAGTYLSAKIPFAYDYADDDADVTDTSGHGTHVSGIAVGYAADGGSVRFQGAAPSAQLLCMKVFPDYGLYTYSYIYFKALEDAYLLGADVINMSLGSISGQSHGSELDDEVFGNIYARLEEAGVCVCTSAGNDSYTGDRPLASYMDYGTLGSPASYAGNFSVASAECPTDEVKEQLNGFSSWGCGSDLTLRPRITAHGGDVLSSVFDEDDSYGFMSGTSMAAPNISGALAALLQTLHQAYPQKDRAALAAMAEARLACTANLVPDENGVPCSPRQQGCGILNRSAAESAAIYLSDPICELGDDPSQSGRFQISFTVENPDRKSASYTISPIVLVPDTYTENGVLYQRHTDRKLSAGEYTFTTDQPQNTVTLTPDTERVQVTGTLQLSAAAMKELAAQFADGYFVEGYLLLQGSGVQPLHATYLGFCGDWNKAGALEQCDSGDYLQTAFDMGITDPTDWNVLTALGSVQYYNMAMLDSGGFLGDNALDRSIRYDPAHNAVSTSDCPTYDYTDALLAQAIALRNMKSIRVEITDAETGKLYRKEASSYYPRSYYNYEYGTWNGFQFYWHGDAYEYDENGEPVVIHVDDEYGGYDTLVNYNVPNNTRCNVRFYTTIDYPDAQEQLAWEFPVTIDAEAPVIQSCRYDPATKQLHLTVYDNQYLRNVRVGCTAEELANGTPDCGITLSGIPDESGIAQEFVVSMDGLGTDRHTLQISDYAGNTLSYRLELPQLSGDETHTIHILPMWGGKIGDGLDKLVPHGGSCTFEILPDTRFVVTDVFVDGNSVGAMDRYEFQNVTADHTIYAEFRGMTATEWFVDLSPTAWYADGVNFAEEAGYMIGIDDTHFFPDKTLNRAMLVTVLHRFAGCPEATVPTTFYDAKKNTYYYDALCWAELNAIIEGFPDGSFRPNDPITREQLATIFYRYTRDYLFMDVSAYAGFDAYTDAGQISNYATSAMHWALGTKLIHGMTATTLCPRAGATRAQFATILLRYVEALYGPSEG